MCCSGWIKCASGKKRFMIATMQQMMTKLLILPLAQMVHGRGRFFITFWCCVCYRAWKLLITRYFPGIVLHASTGRSAIKRARSTKKWKKGHESKCDANYVGSASGMEAEGISDMYSRYLSLKFQYKHLICDGDITTHSYYKRSHMVLVMKIRS